MKQLLRDISKANNYLLKERSIDKALNFCISEIGLGQNIDKCYVFKNKIDGGIQKFKHVYDWCANDIKYIDCTDKNGFPYDALPGLYDALSSDKAFHGLVSDIDDDFFKNSMEMAGFKSYLFTPVFLDNSFWGWIGYYVSKNERKWSDEEVSELHSLAKNIGFRLNQDEVIFKLEANLEKYDFSIVSNSNQAIWELDLATDKIIFSYNWAGMLGYLNGEVLFDFDFFKENCHPLDINQVIIDLKNYVERKSNNFEGVTRILHQKGHYVYIKYSGLLKKNSKGMPKKIIGTFIDISELKEKEDQIEFSDAKFKFIAENSKDLICLHTSDGKFSYVSKSSKTITGYSAAELSNKNPLDFIDQRDLINIKNQYNKNIRKKNNGILLSRFIRKNKKSIWLETSIIVIVDAENQVLGFQTSSRDVSERIKTERESEIASRKERRLGDLKSKFVAMASHQFRTPLTVIYSNAELLDLKANQHESKIADELKLATLRIRNEVDRMTALMNNILIFGKYEAKKIEKNIQAIDFNKFILSFLDTHFDYENQGRKINLTTIGEHKIVFTDESLMVHILTNIINNALIYSTGKKDPLLTITYLENKIEIKVVDFGMGIPQNEIKYLFTSFFRTSNTSTIMGSGLGLVLVKQFTILLNGKIELKSKENFGTTIKLTFPYEQ